MSERAVAHGAVVIGLGIVGVGIVGALDMTTGAELSFGVFYLVPIAWVTWRRGRHEGIVFAFLSAFTWYGVEVVFGREYSSSLAPAWNAAVRLGFFVLVALLLSRVRDQLQFERAQNSELNRLNEALDGYAAHVAHDLRGPLANVAMAASALSRDDPTQAEFVSIIEASSARGIQLTEDLLGLAKASATPRRERVDVGDVVRAAAEGIAELDVTLEEPLHVISADPIFLRACLTNLFENAGRYARLDDGRADVTVSSRESPEGWIISVADRGPGLSAADVGTVFTPFVRGTVRDGQGTGLGLAIVAAAAEAHAGRAWYEPREGGGSSFHMLFRHSR